MRVLRDTTSIYQEITSSPDAHMAHLLSRYVQYLHAAAEDGGESISVVLIEPGDTLQTVDTAMEFRFLVNHYSGKSFGDPGFLPCFETLTEYPTVYEMFFIEGGGELGISLLIPKQPGIDHALLDLCARHATSVGELSP